MRNKCVVIPTQPIRSGKGGNSVNVYPFNFSYDNLSLVILKTLAGRFGSFTPSGPAGTATCSAIAPCLLRKVIFQ